MDFDEDEYAGFDIIQNQSDTDMDELERPRPKKSPTRPMDMDRDEYEDEVPIRAFDLPQSSSIRNLTKTQLVEFALQHTTPELLLSCLAEDDNIRTSNSAVGALQEIQENILQNNDANNVRETGTFDDMANYNQIPEDISQLLSQPPPRRKRSPPRRKRSPPRRKQSPKDNTDLGGLRNTYFKIKSILDSPDITNTVKKFQEKRLKNIVAKLRAMGVSPSTLQFGNRFGLGPARSSKLYGIQLAPPQYVGPNQMVYPKGPTSYNDTRPSLDSIVRSYSNFPGSGNISLSSERAIAFGIPRNRRSYTQKPKIPRKPKKSKRSFKKFLCNM